MEIKNRFSPSQHVISPSGGPTLTQQQFKDDADINSIMRKFQQTGIITHVSNHQPQYGFADSTTLHDAMNVIRTAETMFADLPSSIRNKFENSPSAFLDFVQDADNYEEAIELGLSLAPEALVTALERQEAAKSEVVESQAAPDVAEGPATEATPG